MKEFTVYSSMHVFTQNYNKVIECLAYDEEREYEDQYTRFSSLLPLAHTDFSKEPLHTIHRHFFQLLKNYPEDTPIAVVIADMSRKGEHLNIYGDILIQKHLVSAFSPFLSSSPLEQMKGRMYDMTKDMTKAVKKIALNHNIINYSEGIECRVYVAGKQKQCSIRRSSDAADCVEIGVEHLDTLFPGINWESILAIVDAEKFSNAFCAALNIPVEGDEYLSNYKYLKTKFLYDIYVQEGMELVDEKPSNPLGR